jgi:hypothetical protein
VDTVQLRSTELAWDDQTRFEVFTYLTQKMPAADIRRKTGVSLRTIQMWKKEWSIITQPYGNSRGRKISNSHGQGRRAYDQDTRCRVSNYLAEGMPVQRISDKTGVCVSTIRRWREEESLTPPNPARGLKWSHEVRSRVSTRLAQSMPVRLISKETGVPIPTIYTWKREEESAAASC